MNRFPLWKNLLLILVLVLGIVYSIPNLYGEDPALQISGNTSSAKIDDTLINQVKSVLQTANLKYKDLQVQNDELLIRFANTDIQFAAVSLLRSTVGANYTVAVNLASATPKWLQMLGAEPMKKGLDLQGGIHFLLEIDTQGAATKRIDGLVKGVSDTLRSDKIRYSNISNTNKQQVIIDFRDAQSLDAAYSAMLRNYQTTFDLQKDTATAGQFRIVATLKPEYLTSISDYTMEQMLTTLRNRINELGIAEAMVTQQGTDRIAVDLPGVQDSAQAKQILGGTATLEFHLVDEEHDPNAAVSGGITPPGSRLYYMTDKTPYLLKTPIVLSGDSITSATSSFGEDGRPTVDVMLGGGESYFNRVTRENVGHRMAIVYVETKTTTSMQNGQAIKERHKEEHVISAPTIQSALGTQFQITGIGDVKEANNLALLLRAGALPTNVDIVEERTIGASLGQENIHLGTLSVEVAFILIVIFMAIYYQVFGLIADVALGFNLILIVAILSMLGATLTLPGIAGIVLTVGMAVDANILIFERIREELRLGLTPQASISAGFERAFATIVDANVSTLIVAVVLFGIGSGPIKGFAVTLTIGILTSMFTAVTFTRGLVNLVYGRRGVKQLAIGIRH